MLQPASQVGAPREHDSAAENWGQNQSKATAGPIALAPDGRETRHVSGQVLEENVHVYPGSDLLEEVGRVTIAGSRLDLQLVVRLSFS
jgi:hypothetical protein